MRRHSEKSRVLLGITLVVVLTFALGFYYYSRTEANPLRVASTWFWRLNYLVSPVRDAEGLAALHSTASKNPRGQCVACHEDKTSSKLVLHRIHLRSELLASLQCHDCHQEVDLSTRGNSSVVTWVDVGFCKGCHSEFPGLKPGSAMKPEYFDRDCTGCHKGEKAPKHAAPYLPDSIPASECQGCHGGRVLPSTARHEKPDWLKTHGEEALRSGSDACYQCHDFGLKFCDRCHNKKPPSHLPAERWRTIHPDAARADTRVCYSCHRTSFCKKCHLNHEAGWLERHSAFVHDEGDSTCGECHSSSSCGFCHMATSNSLESSPVP